MAAGWSIEDQCKTLVLVWEEADIQYRECPAHIGTVGIYEVFLRTVLVFIRSGIHSF